METFNLIASNIENLELKLNGELPIDRDELLALVNSWGRNKVFYTLDKDNNNIKIEYCEDKEKYNLSNLDVSQILNFDDIFYYSNFDNNIDSWDISNATSLSYMFSYTTKFNSPLDKWNVSKVTNMKYMFANTKIFNQPLNKWDTSKVKSMSNMFCYTKKFNQDISMWNISQVINMSYMFFKSEDFNQDLNSLDISNVKDMENMFAYSEAFNQTIFWDLSQNIDCYDMFTGAKAFEIRFNNGKHLPYGTDKINDWLKENRNKMIALDIEDSKGKELDNFLTNINNKNIIIH